MSRFTSMRTRILLLAPNGRVISPKCVENVSDVLMKCLAYENCRTSFVGFEYLRLYDCHYFIGSHHRVLIGPSRLMPDLIDVVLLSNPDRTTHWLGLDIRTVAFYLCHCFNWELIANEITWSRSGLVVCARPLSVTTGLQPSLCIDEDLSSIVRHRIPTDNQ